MSSELTYDDFLDRLSIQEVLVDAGYHLNKRDGLRYPSSAFPASAEVRQPLNESMAIIIFFIVYLYIVQIY